VKSSDTAKVKTRPDGGVTSIRSFSLQASKSKIRAKNSFKSISWTVEQGMSMCHKWAKAGRWVVAILVFASLIVGCKSKPAIVVQPVKGKVVREGKGLGYVKVTFWPRDPKLQRVEVIAESGGEFATACAEGTYVVTIIAAAGATPSETGRPSGPPTTETASKEKPTTIPKRYQDRQSSTLTLEVPAGGKDGVVFDISK
jgi:hypothetical protein